LRWIADKPARLAAQRRRRRLVVAALVVLTVALAVVTALAYSASQARDLARRRQLQAEELITFLLKDLKEPLEAVGKLDLLSAVSQRALSYFRSVREAELSFTERIQQLEALQLLAQIEMARGQLQSARQILLQALEANPPLSGLSEPERGALYLARSRLWSLLGSLDLEAPEPEDRQRALGAFMEAYREAQLGAEHLPENPNLEEELASAASGLGIALRSNGRLAEAVIHLKEAADRFEKLVAANPQVRLKLRSALVETLGWLSSTHFELGQLKEAFAVREKQVVPLKLLTDLEPNNRIFRNDLSVAETHLAVLLEGMGRLDDAIRTQQQALIHAEQLVAFEPNNADWRRNWVLSQGHLGHYLFFAGRSEAAQPLLKKSVGELVQLGRERPDLRIWPRFEAVHRIRLARAEAALGHPSEAQEELRRARKLLGPFQAGDPKQWDPLLTLAFAHLALAEVELLGFGSAADPETEKLAEILEALRAPATARNFRAQDLRARLLIALGRAEEARQEVSWLLNQGWASSGFREAVRASALQDLLQASSADGP
jgi:tetratricopeptide (TPR) repeat protein